MFSQIHHHDSIHDAIARYCGRRGLATAIADARRRVRMCNIAQVPMPTRRLAACEEHLQIIDALMSGDPERAPQAMIDHLDHVRNGYIELLRAMPGYG
jgi:DNA-binding GntR family transcriptional regulator